MQIDRAIQRQASHVGLSFRSLEGLESQYCDRREVAIDIEQAFELDGIEFVREGLLNKQGQDRLLGRPYRR